MNLYTYLMIKNAAGPINATDIALGTGVSARKAENQARRLQRKFDKRNAQEFPGEHGPYDYLPSNGYDELVDHVGDPRIAGRIMASDRAKLQKNYDSEKERHGKATAMISDLQGQLGGLRGQIGDLEGSIADLQDGRSSLRGQLGVALDSKGKANNMLKNIGMYGGAGIGALAGGGLGYGGGSLVSRLIGLKGRKAMALKALGAAAGAGLGGWGGYELGKAYMPQY